jgi:hypothetical protein
VSESRSPSASALATVSAWLCRLSPLPWICAAVFFVCSREKSEAIAAGCLIACFVSLTMAVVGGFGFFRVHSETNALPPRTALILGAIGMLGGMVTAMASVLIADFAASAN